MQTSGMVDRIKGASIPRTIDIVSLVAAGFLFPVAYVDLFFVPSWTPRMALVLLTLPLGSAAFAELLRNRDRAAFSGLLLMAVCTTATLVADVPLWNLRGGFARESNLVFLLGFFSLWALARRIEANGRLLVATASFAGIGVSVLFAAGQMVTQPSAGFFEMIGRRPSGLLVNPVYFGAALAGVGAASAHAWARKQTKVWVAAGGLAASSLMVGYSGSRGATLGLLVGVVSAALIVHWPARAQLLFTAVGGLMVASIPIPGAGNRDAVARVGDGTDGRLQIWRYGIDALLERPVLGHGFGQFRPAVQGHFSPDFVRSSASDINAAAWPDAHNLLVQYAVVGGIVAVGALLAFVWFAGHSSRGPLAWAAGAAAFTWLLQPATLAVMPLVAIWLGLAGRVERRSPSDRHADRRNALLLVLGATLALSLLGLDNRLRASLAQGDVRSFVSWVETAPNDPVLSNSAASVMSRSGDVVGSLRWRRHAAELEPRDAVVLSALARAQLDSGDANGAAQTIVQALGVDPYNPAALRAAETIAEIRGDEELADLTRARSCAIELIQC